jgi:hypothetical protein
VDLKSSLEELQAAVFVTTHPIDFYALEPNISLPDKLMEPDHG